MQPLVRRCNQDNSTESMMIEARLPEKPNHGSLGAKTIIFEDWVRFCFFLLHLHILAASAKRPWPNNDALSVKVILINRSGFSAGAESNTNYRYLCMGLKLMCN